jgi:hypothetical protein
VECIGLMPLARFKDILDQIGNLTSTNKSSSKVLQNKLLPLCDRALSEQYTTAVALTNCRRMLSEWARCASLSCVAFDSFASQATSCFQPVLKSIAVHADKLVTIGDCFTRANASRITVDANSILFPQSDSGRSKKKDVPAVVECSPLDMLTRGVLGAPVAELVNALRLFVESDIKAVAHELHTLRKELRLSIDAEVRKFQSMKADINAASQASCAAGSV